LGASLLLLPPSGNIEGVISMREKSRAWLLATPVLAMFFAVTGVASSSHESDSSPNSKAFYNTTPGLVDKTWELQVLEGSDCSPPLGIDASGRSTGIVKRTVFFRDQGILKQQDTISPGGETKNLLQAAFEIVRDTVNIRWKPEDQQVDTYKIASLTDTSVTLANETSTCRYTHAKKTPRTESISVRVDSTGGWQDTGIIVAEHDTVSVTHQSGSWTVDYRNFPEVGPQGYDDATDARIYQGCKVDSAYHYGVLLARIGSGDSLPIGTAMSLKAQSTGPLALRINDNDDCLGDNSGSVSVIVTKQSRS
jgi:hypothetical protein